VTEASEGEDALRPVAKEAPDLALLDLQMPRLDGYGVLKRLTLDAKTRLFPGIQTCRIFWARWPWAAWPLFLPA
jgi:CheY-like chemotaxis protein